MQLLVKNIQLEDGKMILASHFFKGADSSVLELTEAELVTAEAVRVREPFRAAIWVGGSCTAHVFYESHSLVLGCMYPLWMYVPASGTVGSIWSWGLLMSPAASSSATEALGLGQLRLTF